MPSEDIWIKYQDYVDQFDPLNTNRQARRSRRYGPAPADKEQEEILAELAELEGLEAGFDPTYQPSRHERRWLLSSIETFYHENLITDVLAQIRGGKEASVYRCRAHPAVAEEFLAAKVYRPRMFRNLRNDARYREGRPVLGPDSIEIDRSERRTMRALRKRTNYGMQVAHGSWLMHEYRALEEMHRAGADVPRPYAVSGNAILMSYHGDGRMAAPTLNTVQLPRQEAAALFERIVTNVEMALELGLVHGDLSAFNVLYWQGRITIIDWPQVTYCEGNHSARSILERDLVRICDHFQSQGVRCHAQRLLDRLWSRYGRPDVREAIADWSALHADSEEEEKQEGAE